MNSFISKNYLDVLEHVKKACKSCGRDKADVALIAVSKTKPVEMLKEAGVKYCIIGHSERRQYFNETDEAVNKKAKVLLENGITPVNSKHRTYTECCFIKCGFLKHCHTPYSDIL